MNLLIQFLLRLSFGLAAGMAITSSKKVTSGYFRNHLYVTLGLTTLAAMVSYAAAPDVFWYCVAAAIVSYVGSVCWLYEQAKPGKIALALVMLASSMALIAQYPGQYRMKRQETRFVQKYDSLYVLEHSKDEDKPYYDEVFMPHGLVNSTLLSIVGIFSSSLLLGMTMAAMLLGHWYLNTPTMELVPLRRLIIAMGVAVVLQAIVSALGLWGELTYAKEITTQWWLFLLLRWSFGIVSVGVLAWMAWQTLKIPNTQSATGILYVAVIGTFVGETMALLLSAESLFPL
jgi:hypothetical protein